MKMRTDQRDVSTVKKACWSYRTPGFGTHRGQFYTSPGPGIRGATTGTCIHIVYIQTHRDVHIHMNTSLKIYKRPL